MREKEKRLQGIKGVLFIVLFWNFLLCGLKIFFGAWFGLLTLLADGVHSLGDSLSNLLGLVALKFSSKVEDKKYPFGYEKFEALGGLFIVLVIAFGVIQITIQAFKKLFSPSQITVDPIVIYVLIFTIIANYAVSWWEGKKVRLSGASF